MRSAIRGDFERLARRRGGQELMREPEEARAEPGPPPEPDEVVTPEPEPLVEPEPVEPEPVEPEPREAVEAVPVGEAAVSDADAEPPPDQLPVDGDASADRVEPEEPRRRSFLDRLLGR
jgi:fused signal recognition particle receptor